MTIENAVVIRPIELGEVQEYLDWRAREIGWFAHVDYIRDILETYGDKRCALLIAIPTDKTDPSKTNFIGSILVVALDDQITCAGMLSVAKPYRRLGIGSRLLEVAAKKFGGDGKMVSINAALSRVEVYQKNYGMTEEFKSCIYSQDFRQIGALSRTIKYLDSIIHQLQKSTNTNYITNQTDITLMTLQGYLDNHKKFEDLMESIITFDNSIHIVPRGNFLRKFLLRREGISTVAALSFDRDGKTKCLGYGVLRPRSANRLTIAPLYAENVYVRALLWRALLGELMESVQVENATNSAKSIDTFQNSPKEAWKSMAKLDVFVIENTTTPNQNGLNGETNKDQNLENFDSNTLMKTIFKLMNLEKDQEFVRMYRGKLPFSIPREKCYALMSSECFLV